MELPPINWTSSISDFHCTMCRLVCCCVSITIVVEFIIELHWEFFRYMFYNQEYAGHHSLSNSFEDPENTIMWGIDIYCVCVNSKPTHIVFYVVSLLDDGFKPACWCCFTPWENIGCENMKVSLTILYLSYVLLLQVQSVSIRKMAAYYCYSLVLHLIWELKP